MLNEYIISTDKLIKLSGSTGITLNGCGGITTAKVKVENIDVEGLKKVLFKEPKVVEPRPLTIDQMVASAKSRLKMFIEAESNWQIYNMKKHPDK